jgi:transcriptional regulator with XRE-family HTH domain
MRAALTQADIAESAGLSTEVYGRLERGILLPSVPTLRRLCLALGTSADALLCLGLGAEGRSGQRAPATSPALREPLPLRRLVRTLRRLDSSQLRALSRVAVAMLAAGPPAAPPRRTRRSRGGAGRRGPHRLR